MRLSTLDGVTGLANRFYRQAALAYLHTVTVAPTSSTNPQLVQGVAWTDFSVNPIFWNPPWEWMREGAARPGNCRVAYFSPHDCAPYPRSTTMKLDATDLRYVTSDEFRVLTAVRNFFLAALKWCGT